MIYLPTNKSFPPVEFADKDGCLAFSLDLSVDRLIEAYHKGIFPWYNEGEPVIWWSPDPRMVLFPKELRISKSMRKILRDNKFSVTYDQNFAEVIEQCRDIPRAKQDGTWITEDIVQCYNILYTKGIAHSVEVWNKNGEMVGGLYGVWVKNVFCGESMFAKESNASKVGFISFVQKYINDLDIIDCQVYTKHLASLGGRLIPRDKYLEYLK